MATVLTRSQVVSKEAPALLFIHAIGGALVDPAELSFAIYDTTTEEKQLAPIKVFPTSGGNHTVDVTESSPDRVGIGRFAAAFTVDANAPYGRYEITWVWRSKAGGPVQRATQVFDVFSLAVPAGKTIYALPSAVRGEGLLATGPNAVSDARLMLAAVRAAAFIETITRRFFEPRYAELRVDGRSSGGCLLDDPVIAIERITYATTHLLLSQLPAESDTYRVYNRHLSGLKQPDDRDNPRIELYGLRDYLTIYSQEDLRFPKGFQNLTITGVFGYTEPDGTPYGRTPELLAQAALLLTIRYTAKATDTNAQMGNRFNHRITSEKTRDQSVTYGAGLAGGLSAGATVGAFTGDPEIDNLIGMFLAPPQMGAA